MNRNRPVRIIIHVALVFFALLWLTIGFGLESVVDFIFGALFTVGAVVSLVRLLRRAKPERAIKATKAVPPFFAALLRIVRIVVDSDILIYLFVLSAVVRFVWARLLSGMLPSLYEIILLGIFVRALFRAARNAFHADGYSESRRAWDRFDASRSPKGPLYTGIVCPYCGQPAAEKAVMCKHCGKSMVSSSNALYLYACPRCKQPMKKHETVCSQCGNIIIEGREEEDVR